MKTVKTVKSRTPAIKQQKRRRQKAKLVIKRNRPIHKRVLLHPIMVFVLLCAGVLIVKWTFQVSADQYVVTAKVAAPALTEAAIFTQPLNGAVFTVGSMMVKGTCPSNSYVVLYRNAAMSGVAWCAVGNTYQIETTLYPGVNTLRVQDFNITDDPGPVTPTIDVTYTPPVITTTNPPTGSTSNNNQSPGSEVSANLPIITSDYRYQTFVTNTNFEWSIDVAGGKSPYQLVTNWGDGTSSTQSVSKTQSLHMSHKYTKSGYYTVIFKIIDSRGIVGLLQIVAIIKSPGSLIGANNIVSNDSQSSILNLSWMLLVKHWLVIAWGSYATVLLMTISFWLGERQKVAALINAKHPPRRQHRV